MTTGNSPIITGLSTRVPGARTRSAMWDILSRGRCSIGTVSGQLFDPARYFDPHMTRSGKTYSLAAGQVDNIYQFDAGFFGISPREAAQMDPQQKLMLQAAWEAIEDSGLNAAEIAGDRTGVYVGASILENQSLYYYDPARATSPFILGNTLCIIANRISASFDFRGPSLVMDAACASGLYAFHIAAEAIRREEIDTAIVGGVHFSRTPGGFVGFSQARMLSPTGICRAFDADADGYVRSEAAIALVLQRSDIAARMGARRRARVLATGINTDGAKSTLTVPSSVQQERLIDKVLHSSQIDPDDISFFEAHGTGTPVGDPIEAMSIGNAIGRLRIDPLPIGSSKTNFGHSEPAAGLVGLAKVLLAFENRANPASLHFHKPNPTIDFEELNLGINDKLTPLPTEGTLIAGINSFGFGGTNASAFVSSEIVPTATRYLAPPMKNSQSQWLMLSAASEPSLRKLAGRWADRLETADSRDIPTLIAAGAARSSFDERLAVQADDQLVSRLRDFSTSDNVTPKPLCARVGLLRPTTVFAFPGNGTQRPGMGQMEAAVSPGFRQYFDDIARAFLEAGSDIDLRELSKGPELSAKLASPLVAQPVLFGYQVALAMALGEAGMRPDALVGHSVGEIAALHLAGYFDLKAAIRIILSRSTAFEGLRGSGGMAAIAASEAEVRQALMGLDRDDLVIAAVNSPRSVTVSGSTEALDRLARIKVGGKRLAVIRLKVEVPYHSPMVEQLRDRFMADIADIRFLPPKLPVASTVLGRMLGPTECDAHYLWRNARDAVRFSDAIASLTREYPCQVVELSPIASFASNLRDLARLEAHPVEHFAPVQGDGEPESFDHIAARAWTQGVRVNPAALAGKFDGPSPELPAYPWDEQYYHTGLSPDGLDAWGEASARYLTGLRAERSVPAWVADFTPSVPVWLKDHQVGGTIVIPGTALIEMVLGGAQELWPGDAVELRDFDIVAAAVVENDGIRIRTEISPQTGTVSLWQRPRMTEDEWTLLARGNLRQAEGQASRHRLPDFVDAMETAALYDLMTGQGLQYGPAFRRLQLIRPVNKATIWARLAEPVAEGHFALDPTGFDAALHMLAEIMRNHLPNRSDGAQTLLPTHLSEMRLWQPGKEIIFARMELLKQRRHSMVVNLILFDGDRNCIADISGLEFAKVGMGSTAQATSLRTRRRLIRLRRPGTPVRLPRGWGDPVRALRKRGFAAEAPEASAIAEVLKGLRLTLVDPTGDVTEALARILDLAPDLVSDARALMLDARGENSLPGTLFGQAQKIIWNEAEAILDRLLHRWHGEQRLNLLLYGLPAPSLLKRLAADPRIDRLALSHTEAEGLRVLTQALPAEYLPLIVHEPEAGDFDLVFQGGSLPTENKELAAEGLKLHIDLPDLRPGSDSNGDGGTVLYRQVDDLALRVRVTRGSRDAALPSQANQPLRLAMTGALPEPMLEPVAAITRALGQMAVSDDDYSHRVLLVTPQADSSLSTTISDILWQLRLAANDKSKLPLLIVGLFGEDTPDGDLLGAAISAVIRTWRNECPDLPCGGIMLDQADSEMLPTLWRDLADTALIHGFIWVEGASWKTERFVRMDLQDQGGRQQLAQGNPGHFESLAWRPISGRSPRAGEVEIEVEATGLNFRDVMSARGILPERLLDIGASGAALGMECAGTVVRVGAGVEDIVPGMRVMGFASGGFATHAHLPVNATAPVPMGLTVTQAAAIPVAFLTAWYALVRVARIRSGDTVLIHGAAGGVGMAAIQVARLYGARVLATAGTPEKRAIARALGADEVFSSRDLDFARAVLECTEGRGVDIVLNSLANIAMQRSLECLAPFGTFLELGKRDYLEGTRLDLRPFLNNLSYHGVDLDQYLAAHPEEAQQQMREISAAFAKGKLKPLPVTNFAAGDVADAFRHMLAARHTGKIVVQPPARTARRKPGPVGRNWVILGGTGGLGLALARELVTAGSQHVHLVSRSGTPNLGSGSEGKWARTSENVSFHASDATDPEALSALFDEIESQTGPIDGVIHSAMVLRDRLITEIDKDEAAFVISAKLGVAETLDKVLRVRNSQPRHVIYFSSIAAQIGNIGQAAYNAANAAVEALAARRRRDGLAGIAIGWGPVGDAGYLARDANLAAKLARQKGITLQSVREVAAELLRIIRKPVAQDHCLAAISWDKLSRQLPALTQPPFTHLVSRNAGDPQAAGDLANDLRQLDWRDALSLAQEEIGRTLATILRMPPEQYDSTRPLAQFGIDSLVAMELRLEIESRFGVQMPALAISRDVTGARLALLIVDRIRGEGKTDQDRDIFSEQMSAG